MKTYEVRVDTTSLVSGLIIITAKDDAHARQKALTHPGATGVISIKELDDETAKS